MSENQSLENLISQLADYRTRHAARQRLKEMGPAVADSLLPLLEDTARPENLRWSVLALLVAWKRTSAAPAILRVARADRGLQSEAVRALASLTGLEIGEDWDEWEKALADPAAYAAQHAAAADLPAAAEHPHHKVGKSPEERGCEIFRRALAKTASQFQWEAEGYLYMRFELAANRKQQIVATFHETDGNRQPLATIYTECGPANPQAVTAVTRRNLTVKHGKFEIEGPGGEQKVVMRAQIPFASLDERLVHDLVLGMAVEADSLELELTQADRI
ncbi:MAG: hypothetical protein RBU25_01290 [Lentisphaeria bacterium]|nr:hypothetical protein [Lentisphaeria bacterium]